MLALQRLAVPDLGIDSEQLLPLLALAAVWIAVWIWICRYLAGHAYGLPDDARGLAPWTAWLLLVPGLNLLWNFFFLLGLASGYRKAFADLGRKLPTRETGRNEALGWSVACALGVYPMPQGLLAVVWLAGFGALVVLLFKLHSLRERYERIEKG